MIRSVPVPAIAYQVADQLDYSGGFNLSTRPVHHAWWLFQCDRCPRALLVYGADDDSFLAAATRYLVDRLWRCDPCSCLCPDCRDWEDEMFLNY